MALTGKSLFLYGYTVTTSNQNLDFLAVNAEPQRTAVLRIGYYSLTSLMQEVVRAMQAADTSRIYTVTADRTILTGTQNRITIQNNGAFLSLLFGSGTHSGSSCASLLGFAASDRTGATLYTGTLTTGTALLPTLTGYNFLSPANMRQIVGQVNTSISGQKETIVYQEAQFFQTQFKYEPSSAVTSWQLLFSWMIAQKSLEFTPDTGTPSTFYEATLEKSGSDSKGMSYIMKEMLPDFPTLYDMGLLTFRVRLY